jgi:hypothetical protein
MQPSRAWQIEVFATKVLRQQNKLDLCFGKHGPADRPSRCVQSRGSQLPAGLAKLWIINEAQVLSADSGILLAGATKENGFNSIASPRIWDRPPARARPLQLFYNRLQSKRARSFCLGWLRSMHHTQHLTILHLIKKYQTLKNENMSCIWI